jgi:hypothetical protein
MSGRLSAIGQLRPGRVLAPRVSAAAVVPRRLTRAIAATLMCMVGVWLPAAATAQGGPATLDGPYTFSWTQEGAGNFGPFSRSRTLTANLHLERRGVDSFANGFWAGVGGTYTYTGLDVAHYTADPSCTAEERRTWNGSGTFSEITTQSYAQLYGSSDGTKVALLIAVKGVNTTTTTTYSGVSTPEKPCGPNTTTTNTLSVHNTPDCPIVGHQIRPFLTVAGTLGSVSTTSDGAFVVDLTCSESSYTTPGLLGSQVTATGILTGPEELTLTADPGGPYDVARAGSVTLDGSGSTGTITAYRWSFGPGSNCPPGTTLKASSKSGKSTTVTALCDLMVTLTVTDADGHTASASTAVFVAPRPFAPTLITHTEQVSVGNRLDKRTPRTPFTAPATPGGAPGGTAAINVSKCATDRVSILCPFVKFGGNRLNKGYTLAEVDDSGGPFHRFSYVASATMSIERIALINPFLLPGGPVAATGQPNMYDENIARQAPIDEFIAKTREHEGEGNGFPNTGHTAALREAIASDPTQRDPNVAVEDQFGPTARTARDLVNVLLAVIEKDLKTATDDPLSVIWGPETLFVFDLSRGWVPAVVTVPGN